VVRHQVDDAVTGAGAVEEAGAVERMEPGLGEVGGVADVVQPGRVPHRLGVGRVEVLDDPGCAHADGLDVASAAD
jgi:hypothetical protein